MLDATKLPRREDVEFPKLIFGTLMLDSSEVVVSAKSLALLAQHLIFNELSTYPKNKRVHVSQFLLDTHGYELQSFTHVSDMVRLNLENYHPAGVRILFKSILEVIDAVEELADFYRQVVPVDTVYLLFAAMDTNDLSEKFGYSALQVRERIFRLSGGSDMPKFFYTGIGEQSAGYHADMAKQLGIHPDLVMQMDGNSDCWDYGCMIRHVFGLYEELMDAE